MGDVIFDYGALADAKADAKKIVNDWGCIESYQSGINNKLKSSLDEWRLAKKEPYGNTYVVNAQQCIGDKVSQLETTATQWVDLSMTIGNFLQYIKDRDNDVVTIFNTTSSQYTDYTGIKGFFNYIGDSFYNFFAVDLANSNGFTRAIADWGKEKMDDLSYVVQQAEDWFKHGNGRYVLNIIGSLALTAVATAGVAISIIGLPFTGGASCSIGVACISLLGVAAGIVSAGISAWNTGYTIVSNVEALENADDPGKARFHGDVVKYSDYVTKHDFGSKEANEKAAALGKRLDTTKAVADTVQVATGLATTFGTKGVDLIDDAGQVTKYTKFDFSASNVKSNVLKTFGFKVSKETTTLDVVDVEQTTMINNADEIGDTTIEMTKATHDADYKSATFEKKVSVDKNKQKTVTKTFTYNKASVSTEYDSLVKSNNVVTEEFSRYVVHAETSSTVIDYTNAASSAKSVAAAKAVNDSAFKRGLTKVKDFGGKAVGFTSYVKASDEDRLESVLHNFVKRNNFVSQVDKYIFKYDTEKDKGYILGDAGKKAGSLASMMWTEITGA